MSRIGKLYLTSTVGVLGYHGSRKWNQLETKPSNSYEINNFLVELTSDKFFDSMFWPIAVARHYHVKDHLLDGLGWTIKQIIKNGERLSKLGERKPPKPPTNTEVEIIEDYAENLPSEKHD